MSNPAASFPLADADLCVKCGLCLPHCPTYRISQHEADGPRGRIALMHGLATGVIGQTPVLEAHLDQCLACRACEAVCPAEVPYGSLIDAGREMLASQRPRRTRFTALIGWVLTRSSVRRGIAWLLWVAQKAGLMALVRRLPLGRRIARLESLLPKLDRPRPWRTVYAPHGEWRGRVAMFVGCVSEIAEADVIRDGIEVLTRLGYEVVVPKDQTCCGAIHLHGGMRKRARALAEENVSIFEGVYDAIVGTSSGCTATLREYEQLIGPEATRFATRIEDLGAFLNRVWPAGVTLRPLNGRVVVHEPCTMRNVLRSGRSASELLKRIPDLKVDTLPSAGRCCGAAGSYFLTETEMADRLVRDQVEEIEALSPDALVTSNVGCALHMTGALRRQGSATPTLHPVSLLARQLRS